jgi:hypothetical protein
MKWFKKHPNITLGIAMVILNLLFMLFLGLNIPMGFKTTEGILLNIFILIVILGIEIWHLRQKNRSLFFLFLNLIPFFGMYSFLILSNKSINKTNQNYLLPENAIVGNKVD